MIPATTGCCRRLRRLLDPHIDRASHAPGANRYRKHFPASAHLWLLILHGLSGAPSLRQRYARLAATPNLFDRIGLPDGISFSEVARSSTTRPSACFETLLTDLITEASHRRMPTRTHRMLRKVQLIDSTFLSLSALLSPWSHHKQAAPGVRIQTTYDLGRHMPRELTLTLVDTNDHEALKAWDLETLRGWTVLCDRGYYGHQQFVRLREAGVSFVTRLQPQASYRVTKARPVPCKATPDGDVVLRDETIVLGSPNNRQGAVVPGIRLVCSRNRNGVEQAFVTDRYDLTAAEVVRLYRQRWQIELFFRFLKQHVQFTRPVGYSREAVWLTVLLAVIMAVLLALIDEDRPAGMSAIAWLRAIGVAFAAHLRGG